MDRSYKKYKSDRPNVLLKYSCLIFFQNGRQPLILDFRKSEIAPFDPPSPKTPP